jgi:hypothetical protein
MGYDIYVYFNVNQEAIEEFINLNNIDRNNSKQDNRIIDYYKEQNPEMKELNIYYIWYNEIHNFYDFYGTNFIRDDPRFTNEEYHIILEEKYQRKFPYILSFLNHNLETAEDAIEIANELSIFFQDDDSLIHFANWLKQTSKYCSTYRLSC